MPTRPPRIFVADDQRDVLESLRLLLKSEGYSAETLANPDVLIGALRERTADAVLMDLNYTRDTTSGDEGLDAVTKIRAFDAHTPIVLMTAWGTINLPCITSDSFVSQSALLSPYRRALAAARPTAEGTPHATLLQKLNLRLRPRRCRRSHCRCWHLRRGHR